jgi:hypothetical protein
MWAEVISNQVLQTVDNYAPITTQDGTKYPSNYPKNEIPNLVQVTLATQPDPRIASVTGYTYQINNGAVTQVAQITDYPLQQVQTAQIAALNTACGQAIEAGFPATINGTQYTITLSPTDQTNALMAATTAQTALTKPGWAASTAYGANSVVTANGECYITFAGGTSGSTAPAWPSAFQAPVTDGTATWYKLGFWVGTTQGNIMIDAPTAIALYEQGVIFVSQQRSTYQALKTEVMAAGTPAAVIAITWP